VVYGQVKFTAVVSLTTDKRAIWSMHF